VKTRACTPSAHGRLKADPERIRTETDAIGVQQVGRGEPALLLFNCRICKSTLAVEASDVQP
jgi:hypothetical protein